MPPRVFVSSVMDDYRRYRAAARRGIEVAGCEPVMAEDFPSLIVSPRNACLDAVQSSDVYVGILGRRAGSDAPSGQTVVEEEFDEARTRGLPILIFLQEGEREPRQQQFVERVSDYIGGRYRSSFDDPDHLEHEVARALEVLAPMVNEEPEVAAEWASNRLERGLFPGGQDPTLRVAIAPVRQEEIIDPRDMERTGRQVLEIGHAEAVGLFSYESGYDTDLQDTSVRITPVAQRGRGGPQSRGAVEVCESGRLFVEANVINLRDRGDRTFGLQIVEEDVSTQLRRIFALAGAFYDRIDEYGRQQAFVYQAGLHDLGYRRLAPEAEAQTSGGGVPMGRDVEVTAHPEPRQINRRDLETPDEEIERTMDRFRRALAQ